MSIKYVGDVLKLFISENGKENRTQKNKFYFENGGIKDDKFFLKNKKREILLVTIDSYNLAKKHGVDIQIGQLGENILMNFNPYSLNIGQKIKIGDVLVEISMNCPFCNHLSKVEQSLSTILKNDRGIFARVLKNGFIEEGDSIYLVD